MKTRRPTLPTAAWLLVLTFSLSGAAILSAQKAGTPDTGNGDKAERAKKLLDQLVRQESIRKKEREFMAQELVEAGRKRLELKRWDEAIAVAKEALDLAPDNEEAKELLVEARRKAGLQGAGGVAAITEKVEAERKVAQQVTHHEMARTLEQGKKLLGAREYREAIDAFENVIALARSMPTVEDARPTAEEARQLIDICWTTIRREKALRQQTVERSAREILTEQRRRQRHLVEARKRVLLTRAKYAMENSQHELAANLIEELLAVDPLNTEAQKLANRIRRTRSTDRRLATRRAAKENTSERMVSVDETMVPPTSTLTYAANWDEIRAKRPKSQVTEEEVAPWKKQVFTQLEKRVSFDFLDTPLADVVAFLQNLTGVNMVLDPAAIQGDDVPVTLKVNDMRLGAALDWILRLANLQYTLRDEAVFVSSGDRIKEAESLRIYEVRDLLAQIPDYSGSGLPSIGEGGGGDMGGEGDIFEDDAGGDGGMTGEELVEFIQDTIAPESWGEEDF